jgi:aerobic carbon-monoxide dehydrogenase large subunit
LLVHLAYDRERQLPTGAVADYLLPTASDFPQIRAVPMGEHPSPIDPLGAKGAGKGGIVPVGGIIANAGPRRARCSTPSRAHCRYRRSESGN